MNEKSDKKEDVSKKLKQTKKKKKQDGWFKRNKNIFSKTFRNLLIIIILFVVCWYFTIKISSLSDDINRSNEKIEILEQKLTSIMENQDHISSAIKEINNKLSEKIPTTFKDEKRLEREKSSEAPKISAPKQEDKVPSDSSKNYWTILIIIVLIAFIVLMSYFLIRKYKQKEELSMFI